jgi:hypothetical protein
MPIPKSPSLHIQIKNGYQNGSRETHQQGEDTKLEPILSRVTKRNNDILGKSTSIPLPPKPSTSPIAKPTIEEEADYNTTNEPLKGTPLNGINEEGRICCIGDTTSREDSKETCTSEQFKGTPLNEIDEKRRICCDGDTMSHNNSTGKRNSNEYPNNLGRKRKIKDHPFIRTIKEILKQTDEVIAKPPIIFEFSITAADTNWKTIEDAGGLDRLIRSSPFSPLSYGSEFRDSWKLAPILHDHPLWTRFKSILDNGSIFPLKDPPPEDVRLQDFDRILEYKNHKSARMMENILNEHLLKEVQRGWLIPLKPRDARKLNNASISPMGVVSQSTINELGEIIPSNRVTHDLSFPGPISGQSINSRTEMDQLVPCYYGYTLNRIIHQIVAYRMIYPTLPIVLQKVDFKSAYRRMHLNAEIATQCLSQTCIDGEDYVLLPLRLSFGGSACPAEWCIASEITTDLANRVLNHNDWDPKHLRAKLSDSIPPTKLLEATIPFHSAKSMIVNPGIEKVGKSDVYVDDICLVGVIKDNETEDRLKNSILLALEIVGRPIYEQEPLIRDELASKSKLLAESGLSETKCMLGWEFNTRKLSIKLSDDKYSVWARQIQEILDARGRTSKKTLEIVTGRLNHAASVIPISRHFLSRIHFSLSKMKEFKRYYLPNQVLKDLKLWLKILQKANSGISLNLLTYRAPDKLYWSDACEYGLGGFSSDGKAWQWVIPENLRNRAHINLLEFMAEIACIWDDILDGKIEPEDCLLAFGDSTTAMGWIHKSKYRSDKDTDESAKARLTVARKLANLVLDNDLKLYSQWFAGTNNEVADFLSREGGMLDNESLTQHLLSNYPTQVPKNCRISVLKPEITSFFSSTLQKLPRKQQQHHSTNALIQHHGESGLLSSDPSNLTMTHSLSDSTKTNETKSPPYSLNTSDPNLHIRKEFQDWLRAQSEIPSAQWHRHSWKTTPLTQECLQMEKSQ